MTDAELYAIAVKTGVVTNGVAHVSPDFESLKRFAEAIRDSYGAGETR